MPVVPEGMSGPLLAVQPEHVSISFLTSALVAPPPPEQGWGLGFDGPTAQRLLALFLLEEIQDVSSPTFTPLPLLLANLQQQLGQAGVVLAHALVGILRGLNSPDDIVSVLHNFSTLLAQPGSTPAVATDACSIAFIATTSPLGMFLRRVRLGLSSMSIQGLAALSVQIQQQLQQLAMQQHQAASSSSSLLPGSGALKDQAVLEAYVNQLLAAVETQGQSLPAGLVDAATAHLSQLQLELPKLEYLRMVVSLAHKDMHAALSSLHKYFDSSGTAMSGGGGTAAAGPGITASGLAAAAASRGKGKHQAALHSLSALHAALGHPQEALAALQELLRLGQQAGDEWGLLHALAGLCRVMGLSEGLQLSSSSSEGQTAAAAGWVGWGLLDLQRTEQQLQLQALLQRCLSTARDMRAPHIAAFAAVALCRFKLQHAAANANGSGGGEAASLAAEASAGTSSEFSPAAGASLLVQRMLLDVATLEHQAAIAAAAPSVPAVAAAPSNTAGGAVAPHLAARSTALYSPSEAFGTGTNTTVVTTLPTAAAAAAAATAATAKAHPVGLGWHSSAAAVSQALATAHLVAASALRLCGANSLAAVQLLMLLTGPGGDAGSRTTAGAEHPKTPQQQQQSPDKTAAVGPGQQQLSLLKGLGCVTGCGVRYDDVVAGWVLVTGLVAGSHGMTAAEHAVSLAAAHFPTVMPEQLSAAQQQLVLQKALEVQDMQLARQACEELQSLAHQQPQLALELQLAAAEADASTHAAAGCWPEAHAAAASLFAVAAAAGMQPHAVRALLMMHKAAMQAGDAAGALPYALSSMQHCQQLQLDALLPEAVLLVASAWQALAPAGSGFALQMLQQVLPVVCASGDLKLQGEVTEAVGKAIMSIIQDSSSWPTAEAATVKDAASAGPGDSPPADESNSSRQAGKGCCISGHRVVLKDAGQWLAAAAAMHEQAGCWSAACSAWLMLAHVCDAMGEEEARNSAAVKWHAAQQRVLLGGQHQ